MRRHHADSRSWTGKDGHVVSAQTWCQAQPHREDRRRTAGPPGDSCRIQLNSIMLTTIAQGGRGDENHDGPDTRRACRAIRCATFHAVGPGLFPFRTRVPGARGETMTNRPRTPRWIARAALGGALRPVRPVRSVRRGELVGPAAIAGPGHAGGPGGRARPGERPRRCRRRPGPATRSTRGPGGPARGKAYPASASTSRGRSRRSDGRPITRRWYGKGRSSRTGCSPPGMTS